MPTQFSTIYDLFTSLVQDYKIYDIYLEDPAKINDYLQNFLTLAVQEFSPLCTENLMSNYNTGEKQFNITLNLTDSIMLARLMVVPWLQNVVQNILQIDSKLSDTDFKTYSEANNLKEKKDFLEVARERNSQLLSEYAQNYVIDWEAWKSGNYYK